MCNKILNVRDDMGFSNENFLEVSSFALANYGIFIPSNKKDLLHARIARRMRALGVSGFDGYLDRISNHNNHLEVEKFISILTTNTTSFFRERHHFSLLVKEILPDLFFDDPDRRVRIWSAGCSFGHEAFSIAAAFNSANFVNHSGGICVMASDVDSEALRRCHEAVYNIKDLEGLSSNESQSLGRVVSGGFKISQKNKEIVDFRKINLVHDVAVSGQFDIIFCRNVMIYFSKEARQKVWERFLQLLSPRGYLILGHSERLVGPVADKFESVGVTAYRRMDSF